MGGQAEHTARKAGQVVHLTGQQFIQILIFFSSNSKPFARLPVCVLKEVFTEKLSLFTLLYTGTQQCYFVCLWVSIKHRILCRFQNRFK
jgi:hypothetical protein